MLLALELLLLHRATSLGKRSQIYALIPLFLIWANMDETFVFGLLILAGATAGRFWEPRRTVLLGPNAVTARSMAVVLLVCSLATLVNPSHIFGLLGAFGILIRVLPAWLVGYLPSSLLPPAPDPISVFGSTFKNVYGSGFTWSFRIYTMTLVGLGLASFALNHRRFQASRFVMFVMASIIWWLSLIYTGQFAAVLVAILALNGQEWYHDLVGTEGRIGGGWTFWSTGGRLATIAMIFVAIFHATTGWGSQVVGLGLGSGSIRTIFRLRQPTCSARPPLRGTCSTQPCRRGMCSPGKLPQAQCVHRQQGPPVYPRPT